MRSFAHPPWRQRACTPLRKFADRCPSRQIPPMGGFTAAISDVQICISGGATSAIGSGPPPKPCQLARFPFWRRTRLTFGKFSEGDHRGSKSCLAPWSCQLASPGPFAPTIRKPANLPVCSAPAGCLRQLADPALLPKFANSRIRRKPSESAWLHWRTERE